MLRSVTIDAAAALDERWRFAVEPVVLGRFTLGLAAAYRTATEVDHGEQPRYRAASLTVQGRWYPQALTYRLERQTIGAYVGEYIGYHRRRYATSGCCYYPATGIPEATTQSSRVDSATVYPPHYPSPLPRPRWVQRMAGWEPGIEFGARISVGRRAVIDVGSQMTLATIDDGWSAVRPGQLDSRFSLAVGIGW